MADGPGTDPAEPRKIAHPWAGAGQDTWPGSVPIPPSPLAAALEERVSALEQQPMTTPGTDGIAAPDHGRRRAR